MDSEWDVREQILRQMKYKNTLQSEKSRLRKERMKQMRKEKAYKLLQSDIYYYC